MERKSTRRKMRPTLRHGTVKKASSSSAVAPIYSPHQIHEVFDYDLHDLTTDDVRFMNRNYQSSYENDLHRQISSAVAVHGVKAAADGDLEYIDMLFNKIVEFATNTKVHTHELVRVSAVDGYNMLHAAIVFKRLDVINKILEYGTEIVSDPVADEMLDTPLILAIKHFRSHLSPLDLSNNSTTNLEVINLLIQFGADINTANRRGDTPLINAAKFQLLEVVTLLTKADTEVHVNACNITGTTALHYAAAFDNKEIAFIFLRLNADVFIADKTGKTPVHIACKYGSEKVLKLIMEARHDEIRKIVRDTDKEGNTPLMLAKSSLKFSAHNLELLIGLGSQLQAFNHDHNRVLHFYSSIDDKDINEGILQTEQSLLHHKNYDLETPLHIAAKFGHRDTCFLYAEKGADIYARDVSNFTPMMNAIAHSHKEVVKVFFNFDYGVEVLVKTGKTLLEWAIELGHLSLIEAMTDNNPPGVIEDAYNGSNLIHYVCKLGNASILRYLLKWDESKYLGRTVTSADSAFGRGHYPMHIAVQSGHTECVKLLNKYGVDMKMKTLQEDDTALHIAARNGYLEIVKFLLSQGVDPELSNYCEGTAMASAAHTGKDNIVAYLLSVGASANGSFERYQLKNTPLLLASKKGHSKVVKLLLEDVVDVSILNEEGHNCLIEAILNGHSCTALIIINSKYWRRAMQCRTKQNETPMRLLIQHMPDVAELALHRCVHREYEIDDKGHNNITTIEYSYEFLDDYITPQPTMKTFFGDICHFNTEMRQNEIEEHALSAEKAFESVPLSSIPTVPLSQNVDTENSRLEVEMECPDDTVWLQEKFDTKNHPLELMVDCKAIALLQCPVVEEMRNRKWKTFGLPLFVFNMILYTLFLVLLTCIFLVGPFPQENLCNISGCWDSWGSWSGCLDSTGCKNSLTSTMTRTRSCTKGFGEFANACGEGASMESMGCEDRPELFVQVNPPVQVANVGENATIECTVFGNPSFSVQWVDSNNSILNMDRSTNRNFSLNLLLPSVTAADYQSYTCVANTSNDTVSASAILTSVECQDRCHVNLYEAFQQTCEERGLESSRRSFLIAADILIIIFCISQLFLEGFQFWRRRIDYLLDFENWLEVIIFVLSMVFASYHLQSEPDCFCADKRTWTVGILAVFFGWIDHVIFLRRLPLTGITISIMYNIFLTMLELVAIAALLIFAFALPLYMLLTIPGRRTPFSSIGRSMLKTLVMTTGEFEFDTIFNNNQESVEDGLSLFLPELTAIIWVVFIIIMPVIFSNLLVGLAVGDTQEELNKAQLTKISLQVRLILEVEDTMSVWRYYARSTGRRFTRVNSWYDFFLGNTKLERREAQMQQWVKQERFQQLENMLIADPLDEIKESLNQQSISMNAFHATFVERLDHLEDQLSVLLEDSYDNPPRRKEMPTSASFETMTES